MRDRLSCQRDVFSSETGCWHNKKPSQNMRRVPQSDAVQDLITQAHELTDKVEDMAGH